MARQERSAWAMAVVAVLAEIGMAIIDGTRGEKTGRRDERDRHIEQLGEYTGQAFVLSAVLGSVTKIALYRGGLPQW